jgi:ubiquinone/menaquinone biosynthesis C-methylase UbiE
MGDQIRDKEGQDSGRKVSHDHTHESRNADHRQYDEHGHDHGKHHHHHGEKSHFHNPQHAADFDQRSTMTGIRGSLTEKMIEMLALKGDERVLDVATGTGRVARPVSKYIKNGQIVGVDEAMAMLQVGHQHKEPIAAYFQSAGAAGALPFKSSTFDRAFVSFSLHHFRQPLDVLNEVLRVLKNGARFIVLDPVIEEAKDALDRALENKINQVFRRTHGDDFRFHTVSSIQRLLSRVGFRLPRTNVLSFSFNQEGMDGIPTGAHWLEAAQELEIESPELAERLKKRYFTWHRHDDHVHVKGGFSYALICGVRPE